jgi:hypothetical protein
MNLEFDDSIRIGTRGGVESNQEIKVKLGVPAPLVFGHRNLGGGVSERRCSPVIGAGVLLDERKVMENIRMIGSSP